MNDSNIGPWVLMVFLMLYLRLFLSSFTKSHIAVILAKKNAILGKIDEKYN